MTIRPDQSVTPTGLFPLPQVKRAPIWLISRLPDTAKLAFMVYNFALKRIYSKIPAQTYFGAKIECNPRDFIQRMIVNFGFWEPNVSAFIGASLKEGDCFVDVGSNIGYHTLLASSVVGKTGCVVSIEALPSTFAILQKNLNDNNCTNVRATNVAASDRTQVLTFYLPPENSLGEATTDPDRGMTTKIEVNAMSLDEILTADEIARTKLIKLDIEGGEIPVVRRLLENQNNFPAEFKILVEISPQVSSNKTELKELFDCMIASGFRAYEIENEYDDSWYLRWRTVTPPREIFGAPQRQTDVVFSRQPL